MKGAACVFTAELCSAWTGQGARPHMANANAIIGDASWFIDGHPAVPPQFPARA